MVVDLKSFDVPYKKLRNFLLEKTTDESKNMRHGRIFPESLSFSRRRVSPLQFPIKIGHDDRIISFRLLFIFKIKQWRPLQ